VSFTLGCRQLEDAPSANVVGEVPGSEKPDEIVLIGAHLDSWDLGQGAIDDGAGVAAVLETGRLLLELPRRPRRTVRVVLFANEENGLKGAQEYARLHQAELAKHLLGLEIDLGAGRVFGLQYLAGPGAAATMKTVAAPLTNLGVSPPVEHDGHGADLWPLRNAGVPVVELQQDASKYFDLHHTADDTLDKVDSADLDQVTGVAAAFTWGAADVVGDLGRIPDDKRK
jgi:Zn-dependent M28 family amino/carboxypeptidase